MDPNGGKHEPADPENAVLTLELELIQQRAARQHANARYRGLRAASFIFLLVIILGALVAFYYAFYLGGIDEVRARNSPQPSPGTTAVSRTP